MTGCGISKIREETPDRQITQASLLVNNKHGVYAMPLWCLLKILPRESSQLLYDFTKLFAPGVYFCRFGFGALDVSLMCIDVFFLKIDMEVCFN